MVCQTVTILILSCAILVLTAVSVVGWRYVWQQTIAYQLLKNINESLQDTCDKYLGQIKDLMDANAKLRLDLERIPLTPKPKPVENATKQPRTSAEVRKMTERAFGRNDIQ